MGPDDLTCPPEGKSKIKADISELAKHAADDVKPCDASCLNTPETFNMPILSFHGTDKLEGS